ncbi:MAG: response regulator [Gemmatimonadetes bacterium]|nr:response regulator [Gemmatimonadota bacterium]
MLADPAAIEQILLNLATNSRDAMPDGGLLRIAIDGTQLGEEDRERHGWVVPGRYVRLSVSDTGIGMDEETRQKVFEPFFTTKPGGSGTGLGMAVVYGLVKQHNGFVHVYSEPGRGTTVKVYLRAMDDAVAPAAAAPAAGEPRDATETILLVEDEPPLRRTACRALERLGYRVLVASDGEEALELFAQHEADVELIVTDLVMPKLGGAELARRLRQQGKQVKILFVSGYTSHDVREGSSLGADAPFLEKPWTIADLGRRVREVLDGAT